MNFSNLSILLIQHHLSKIFLFYKNNLLKNKAFQQNAKGLRIVWLPRQDEFRNFCVSGETEKVYHELEEIINI